LLESTEIHPKMAHKEMILTIHSSCGNYEGEVKNGRYGDICCYITLKSKAPHKFFDQIKQKEPDYNDWLTERICGEKPPPRYAIYDDDKNEVDEYYLNTPCEITYIEPNKIGWFARSDNLQTIIEEFENFFRWLNVKN